MDKMLLGSRYIKESSIWYTRPKGDPSNDCYYMLRMDSMILPERL